MAENARQQVVIDSVRQWQTRLLQLDRRNGLLYYKAGKRGVSLRGRAPQDLFSALISSRSGMAFTYAERVRPPRDLWEDLDAGTNATARERDVRVVPGDLDTDLPPLELQKRLGGLHKRMREWQEEQGIDVLFLAFGFLRWIDEEQEPAVSPLLLVPCDLTRESPRDPYVLHADDADDPSVNPTLRHKLVTAAGVELPELGEETISDYLATVQELVADREGWAVEASSALSTFPFSKLAMWEDLERLVSSGVDHPLVRRLGGELDPRDHKVSYGTRAIPVDDEQLRGAMLDDILAVRDQYAVVDADFSQIRAIELARSGANMVIHGPPGTGKSQTIANIIATLLAHGKKVLFVSEKTAALDVVKRRLSDVGLGDACLDLHSDRGKKTSVYRQLKNALEQPRVVPAPFPYDQLVTRRSALNKLVRELHTKREPLGLSVFEVHGRVAALGELPSVSLTVIELGYLDASRLARILDAAQAIARRAQEFREHYTSRWRPLASMTVSPRLGDALRTDLAGISQVFDRAGLAGLAGAAVAAVRIPDTLVELDVLARVLALLEVMPSAIPAGWLEQDGVEVASGVVAELRSESTARRRLIESLTHPDRRDSDGAAYRASKAQVMSILFESKRWSRIAGAPWETDLITAPESVTTKWLGVEAKYLSLFEAASELFGHLVWERPRTLTTARESGKLANRLIAISPIPTKARTIAEIAETRTELEEARVLSEQIQAAERVLSASFDLVVVDRVDHSMLVRYKTDYRRPWRWFIPSFRRDHRELRGCLHHPRRISVDEATVVIRRALELQALLAKWSKREPRWSATFGRRYKGVESDWKDIGLALVELGLVYKTYPSLSSRLYAILSDGNATEQLARHAVVVRDALESAHTAWAIEETSADVPIDSLASEANAFANASVGISVAFDAVSAVAPRPLDFSALVDLLSRLVHLADIEDHAARRFGARAQILGARFRGWQTDLDDLSAALAWTRDLMSLAAGEVALREIVIRGAKVDSAALHARSTSGAAEAVRAQCAKVAVRIDDGRFPWGAWKDGKFGDIMRWCGDLIAHADEAVDWVDYRTATSALDDAVGGPAVEACRQATDEGTVAARVIARHAYMAWLDRIYSDTAELRVAHRDHAALIREFQEVDRLLPVAARTLVRVRCQAALNGATNASGMGEVGVLNHQLTLKRRQLAVRKLVAKIPNILQALKPCFMMSPLAVSQYLPRGATNAATLMFDAVIFDEASQVRPEDAVPAVARGSQCIVVGDQQQLPPSKFFVGDDDDVDEDDETDEIDENRLAGVESFLDVLVGMKGAGVDDVYLQVHYRSQHDALIRYSNHYFYDDRLLTFPSAFGTQPGLGLHGVFVPDGRFEAGGSRTNRREAEIVVECVFKLMASQPLSESIGVVALSRPQADLIEELIDRRRVTDRQFDERFAEDGSERFFVKNLESVQGDERDHVILSVGYGPTTASGLVPNRFGPVNTEGGHRRLNVAVSRARRSMTVVHSLRSEDIRSETLGAKLLKRYLEYVQSGEASIEGAVSVGGDGEAESPFEEAVGRALVQRGYRIERQVGCAKYFIDLAVCSETGTGFDLAIECDGATYHRSPSARDRDRLRQEILERMGWRGRIHRVWSTAWIRNPRAELDAIEQAIAAARSLPRYQPAPTTVRIESLQRADSSDDSPYSGGRRPATFLTPATKSLLLTYAVADLRVFSTKQPLQDEDPSRVAEIVRAVVRTEQPVHIDEVIERIRVHYGLQRAGNRVRDAVEKGIRQAVRRQLITYWPPSTSRTIRTTDFLSDLTDHEFEPRGPAADGSVRPLDHVSDDELDAAMMRIVKAMVGASYDEATTATARALGYARSGEHVTRRLRATADRLKTTGRLVERVGSLVAVDN